MTKMTKREKFNLVIDALLEMDGTQDLVDFVTEQIVLLDKKAAKAKETAAAKKADDTLLSVVKDALTNEFLTTAEIVARVDDENVTTAKAAYRLNKLVEQGVAEKTTVTVDKRKLVAFKLA